MGEAIEDFSRSWVAGPRSSNKAAHYVCVLPNFSNAYFGYLNMFRWGIKRVIKTTLDVAPVICAMRLTGCDRIEVFLPGIDAPHLILW